MKRALLVVVFVVVSVLLMAPEAHAAGFDIMAGLIIAKIPGTVLLPQMIVIAPATKGLLGLWAVGGIAGFVCPLNFVLGYGVQKKVGRVTFGVVALGFAAGPVITPC